MPYIPIAKARGFTANLVKVVELYDYLISNWDSVYNINLTYKVLFALLEIQSKIVYKNCEDELHNIKLI